MINLYLNRIGLIVGLLLIPTTSHAYLEPGVWAYAINMFIAMLAVAAYSLKTYWYRIQQLWKRLVSRKVRQVTDPTEDTDVENTKNSHFDKAKGRQAR